jgi:dTDP-4-amino-4,6-dideoxygalactose transaminase
MVDKYSWVDVGSSYLMNDVSAAYLWGNLEKADEINQNRLNSWQKYYDGLKELENRGFIELPKIPDGCVQNAHMFYIKVKDLEERTDLLDYLKKNDINAVFHYVPLHSSEAGLKFSKFFGKDIYTTKESEKLIRLPIYYKLEDKDIKYIVNIIYKFFGI